MKILLFPELSTSGGINSFFYDLLKIHKNNKIDTIIVLPSNIDKNTINEISKSGFGIDLVQPRKQIFKKPYLSLFYEMVYYKKPLKKHKPDIVIANMGTPGLNFALFFSKYPLIYILHTYPPKFSWKTRCFFSIPRYFLSKKKRIYSVSDFAKNRIVDYWRIEKNYVEVIYNSFHNDDNNTSYYGEKKIILTLGHLEKYKNPLLWIKIAKTITSQYSNVEFIWLGEGKLYDKCIALSINHKNIKFLGYQSNVIEFYKKAYIYIQPSEIESLGMSVIDALSYGIPVIVSNNGGLPETIQNKISGFICLNKEHCFVQKISLLIERPEIRELMGKNARMYAKNVFNPDIQNKKIMTLYKSISLYNE